MRRYVLLTTALTLVVFCVFAEPALAANGDLVHTTNLATPCPVDPIAGRAIGVGITFDGRYLWYSCTRANPDLYKVEPLTGAAVASYNVAGGLGALAWDGTRQKIWAGWGGGSGSDGDIRQIDPATGIGSVVFNAADAAFNYIDDGLAYDAQLDLL